MTYRIDNSAYLISSVRVMSNEPRFVDGYGQDSDDKSFVGDFLRLHDGISNDSFETCEQAVANLRDINAKLHYVGREGTDSKNDETPLHKAAEKGNEQIIKLLLRKGADPSLKNSLGQTPKDLAQKPNIVTLLAQKFGGGKGEQYLKDYLSSDPEQAKYDIETTLSFIKNFKQTVAEGKPNLIYNFENHSLSFSEAASSFLNSTDQQTKAFNDFLEWKIHFLGVMVFSTQKQKREEVEQFLKSLINIEGSKVNDQPLIEFLQKLIS